LIPGEERYGHVSAHTGREAIITDGLVTSDLISIINYEEGYVAMIKAVLDAS